jgi:hypothetical protein
MLPQQRYGPIGSVGIVGLTRGNIRNGKWLLPGRSRSHQVRLNSGRLGLGPMRAYVDEKLALEFPKPNDKRPVVVTPPAQVDGFEVVVHVTSHDNGNSIEADVVVDGYSLLTGQPSGTVLRSGPASGQGPEILPWLDGYRGQSTGDLIGLEGRVRFDSLVLAFEEALRLKAARRGEPALSDQERVVLAVETLEREVNNGGYGQLFLNCPEAVDGLSPSLRAIGCGEVAEITERAVAALRVEGRTVEEAMAQEDRARDERLEECDRAYLALGLDLAGPLFAYIKENSNGIVLDTGSPQAGLRVLSQAASIIWVAPVVFAVQLPRSIGSKPNFPLGAAAALLIAIASAAAGSYLMTRPLARRGLSRKGAIAASVAVYVGVFAANMLGLVVGFLLAG